MDGLIYSIGWRIVGAVLFLLLFVVIGLNMTVFADIEDDHNKKAKNNVFVYWS